MNYHHLLHNLRPRSTIAMGSYGPFGWWPYRLPINKLTTHMYIVGRSGSGKSKFIESLVWQLILRDQGCIFIDPHADSANHLLRLLAAHSGKFRLSWLSGHSRAKQLIYCEPGRTDFTIPWNILNGTADPYTIATNVWEAFRRTWNESLTVAPQSKNIAIHCLLLLIEHQLTLADLPRLIIDNPLRNRLVARSSHPQIVEFFQHRYAAWGKQGLLRAEPLLNKVTALTLNPHLHQMLGASQNKLDLRDIMDNRKILIVNLGLCDLETRALIGSLLTVSLEQAAMARITQPQAKRTPCYCVIDEFQGFVETDSSSHILSETRKAGLRFIMAHQGQYQLPPIKFRSMQEQTPIKVTFGCGAETATAIANEVFHPKGNLPPDYLTRQKDHLALIDCMKRQRPRQMMIWQLGERVRWLRSCTVPQPKVSDHQLETIKQRLLKRHGQPITDTPTQNSDPSPRASSSTSGSLLG